LRTTDFSSGVARARTTFFWNFDDFIYVDRADVPITEENNLPGGTSSQCNWPSSAQWAIDKIASLIGFELELTKHKPTRSRNVLFGVEGNMSKFKTEKKISSNPPFVDATRTSQR